MESMGASRRRPETTFAFGMFGIEGGFAVSHQYDRTPSIIRPGDPVSLRVSTVPDHVDVVAYTLDGSGPYSPGDVREHGDLVPFYRSGDDWVATLLGKPDDTTTHYIVEATDTDGGHHYADGRLPLEHAKVFTHRTTSRTPPQWAQKAVVYQIFVDRFANEDGMVAMPEQSNGWAGGDLHGVTANLDWLADLGVDCVWLTPVFTCHSYHGYDAVDLKSVDPRFGGDDALHELVTAAHSRGIRILLDLVPNHISRRHPWFVSALAGGPERDWFFFHPDGSYRTFFGVQQMPKLNLDHPDARAATIDVADYWVREFGVDGYRIDHALGPSESFFAALSTHMQQHHPDVWMFGEVTASAQVSRRYGGILDGVTDFPFAYGMRELLAGRLSALAFAEVERESAAVLDPADFSWVRFFDNHDMGRAIHGWDNDTATLTRGLDILLSLPGVPTIFYGTEQALTHDVSEKDGGMAVGRLPMSFDRSHPLFTSTRSSVARRRAAGSRQGTPLYWSNDGSQWSWGNLSGHL